jgi:hypothetical protein
VCWQGEQLVSKFLGPWKLISGIDPSLTKALEPGERSRIAGHDARSPRCGHSDL